MDQKQLRLTAVVRCQFGENDLTRLSTCLTMLIRLIGRWPGRSKVRKSSCEHASSLLSIISVVFRKSSNDEARRERALLSLARTRIVSLFLRCQTNRSDRQAISRYVVFWLVADTAGGAGYVRKWAGSRHWQPPLIFMRDKADLQPDWIQSPRGS